jgi:predicted transcriptional regulator
VAGVRQGLAEIERGERIPIEEIERELPSWVIR